MKEKDVKYFQKLLKNWLEQLTNKADNTVIDLLAVRETPPDPIDQACSDSDRDFTLRIRDRESRLIQKIRQSLDNIENGAYGLCEMCGEEISIARLKARPVAMHCIDCKRKMEKEEKFA